jgi:sulfur-carrier protein
MKVRVKLFAAAKELAGCEELAIELPQGATVRHLRDALVGAAPGLGRIVPHSLWAVGAEYATNETLIVEGCDVALIPPVSGG